VRLKFHFFLRHRTRINKLILLFIHLIIVSVSKNHLVFFLFHANFTIFDFLAIVFLLPQFPLLPLNNIISLISHLCLFHLLFMEFRGFLIFFPINKFLILGCVGYNLCIFLLFFLFNLVEFLGLLGINLE